MTRNLFSRKRRKQISAILVALITLTIYIGQQQGWIGQAAQSTKQAAETTKKVAENSAPIPPGTYKVTEFIDGDTIAVDMDGHTEKVRFIGVDTPETHDPRKEVQCFGQAAAKFTRDFIASYPVRLESDPTNTNRDRYDRLLRYVYLANGDLVNAEIIKQGYGFAYVLFPFQKMDEFKAYEADAKAGNKGLWSSCSITQDGQAKHTNDAPK